MRKKEMVEMELKVDIKKVNGNSVPMDSKPKLSIKTSHIDVTFVTLDFNGQRVSVEKQDLYKAVKALMG